jgi:hypothetical protein
MIKITTYKILKSTTWSMNWGMIRWKNEPARSQGSLKHSKAQRNTFEVQRLSRSAFSLLSSAEGAKVFWFVSHGEVKF